MILAIIGVMSLFMLSVIMPFFGFLLPVYKIKKMKQLKMRDKLIVNVTAMALIGFLDLKILPFYIGIFLVIETLYYYFKKMKPEVEVFDRIMISSSLVTIISMAMFSLIVGEVDLLGANKEVYLKMFELTEAQVEEVFTAMRANSVLLTFIYSFTCNYLTYFVLDGKTYRNWKISYKWIVPYIGIFFAKKIGNIDNFYLNNIFNISMLLYVVFGIKVVYSLFRSSMGTFRGLMKFISISVAIMFPNLVFILGVMNSFNAIKIVVRKEK